MTTTFIYLFLFSTWGLGLLSWVAWLGHQFTKWDMEAEDKTLDLEQKKLFINKLSTVGRPSSSSLSTATTSSNSGEIHEKIKKLMEHSPNHPEVGEIDGSDKIIGIKFEAKDYPPGFGDGDMDDED